MTNDAPQVVELYRYPVKGLTGEQLFDVKITQNDGFPDDRVYALARSDGSYLAGSGGTSKTEFHTLAKDERLAGLSSRLLDDRSTLVVSVRGHEVLRANLAEVEGRASADRFFARVLAREDSPPVFAYEPGRRFTDCAEDGDVEMNYISVINLASVRDVSDRIGARLDPLRFRANMYWDGLPPFAENELVGRVVEIGDVRFAVRSETARCAATEVDPATARRDIQVPRLMKQTLGHTVLGVYLQALGSGQIRVGDPVNLNPLV